MDNTGDPGSKQSSFEGQSADESTPEFAISAFELVTEETRAAILGALAKHQAENPRTPTLEFTELREATGVEDSGNFNYHLGKLQPEYVRKTATR